LGGGPGNAFRQGAFVAAIVILAGWVAYRDVKLSTVLMLWVECLAVLVTLVIVLAGVARTHVWVDPAQLHLAGVHLVDIRLSFVLAFLTLAGVESVTTLGAESKNATTTIPRAIFGTLLPVGLLYLTVTYALVALSRKLSVSLDQADAPLDVIARSCGVPWLGLASSFGVGVSYFGCTLASLIAGTRVLYAMARDGNFAAKYGEAHATNRTPHRATLLVAGIGLLVPVGLLAVRISLPSCIDYLSQLSAFGFILAYFFVCLSTPFYLHRQRALAPWHLVIVAGALVLLGVVLVLSIFPAPPPPWRYLPYIFLAAVLAGVGTTAVYRRAGLRR
jgi:amino acid transporter